MARSRKSPITACIKLYGRLGSTPWSWKACEPCYQRWLRVGSREAFVIFQSTILFKGNALWNWIWQRIESHHKRKLKVLYSERMGECWRGALYKRQHQREWWTFSCETSACCSCSWGHSPSDWFALICCLVQWLRKMQHGFIEITEMFICTNSVNCCEKPYISLHELIHFTTKILIILY